MNIAALPTAADPFTRRREATSCAAVARIEIFDDIRAAEPRWRELARAAPYATPYQQFAWVSHWFAEAGRRQSFKPLIVVALDRDDVASVILPFMTAGCAGGRIARFCGGSHSNLNMPVWRADAAAELTAARLTAVLADVAAARRIDLFALQGQPAQWRGVTNPFAALPRQPSPDDVYNGSLDPADPQFKPRLPGSMRKKERKLMKLDGYRLGVPRTAEAVERALDAFCRQKAARFARQGIANVFDAPGVVEFIRAACLDGLAEARPVIELHTLEGAGEVIAVIGGVWDQDRYSVMFNSITDGDLSRLSPGIILMAEVVADCARRRIPSFDLGAGQAAYKEYFCTGAEQRFDCFVAFSARGRLMGQLYRTLQAIRRRLKTSTTTMALLQTIRRWTTSG